MADDRTPDPWLDGAWRLLPHRVPRFYRGGRLLDKFRGVTDAADTDRPEDWIGSATRAWTRPGTRTTEEGRSVAVLEDGNEERAVAAVLAGDPVAVAGRDLPVGPDGEPTTGLLVKLLDAGSRLPVHAHPSRPFARRHLGSAWGKAEAWIVLGTRDVAGEPPPHVRLGFRRAVNRGELRGWIERQDGAALRGAMHERPTRAGDVWLVPPGTPHAIGAGVFILEVQEPTDFSIVLELGGFPVDPDDAHLALGWDVALDAIDRRAMTDDELAALHRRIPDATDGPEASRLLPNAAVPWFGVTRLRVGERANVPDLGRFLVGIATAGSGTIETSAGPLPLRAGEAFAIPARAASAATFVADEPLDLLLAQSAPEAPLPR